MTVTIGRLLAALGGAAAAWPLAARAQQLPKLRTIGFLGGTSPSVVSQSVAAFVQRLHELGWMEGRNVAIEYRWAEGRSERFAEIAAEFVRLKVDVIVTVGGAVLDANRVGRHREHDRDDRCRPFGVEHRPSHRDNDIDLEPDELGGDFGEAFAASLRPAILDRDGATFHPTKFVQPLHKGGNRLADHRGRGPAKEPDSSQLWQLLRPGRQRPSNCRAAEQCDELAALHHSITLSARARSEGGTSMRSILAV